jgi:biopolymer transport protein ExbB
VIDLIDKGGIVMYPIILCSIIGLAVFIERLWVLRRKNILPSDFIRSVEELLRKQKVPEAVFLWESIEEMGGREAAILEKRLSTLATIASLSPLLGLLGTVSGMIKVFNVISVLGPGNPGPLAGGIAEALITTFAGLCVAIPATVCYSILKNRAESLIFEMEENSMRVVDIMQNSSATQG